jgi:hypothetical protein
MQVASFVFLGGLRPVKRGAACVAGHDRRDQGCRTAGAARAYFRVILFELAFQCQLVTGAVAVAVFPLA